MADYETNKYGIITSPGKFEGEMWYVPRLHEMTLESFEGETIYDGETPYSVFRISRNDDGLPFIGDLILPKDDIQNGEYLVLSESDQGFVSCHIISRREYKDWLQELEEEEDEIQLP